MFPRHLELTSSRNSGVALPSVSCIHAFATQDVTCWCLNQCTVSGPHYLCAVPEEVLPPALLNGCLPHPLCPNMGQVRVQGGKLRKHRVVVFGQARVTTRHLPRNTCCRQRPTLPLKTSQYKGFLFMCTTQVPLSCLHSD